MNFPLKNHPGILITSATIILLMVWGFWPKPVLVETAQVKLAPLQVTIEADGRTRVIDRYLISSPVNGMTCQMHLKVGDTVDQGQTLLNITPLQAQVLDSRSRAQAQAQVSAAKSALQATKEQASAAQAAAKLAKAEFQRYQSLLNKGLVAKEVYDKAQTSALTASAQQRDLIFHQDCFLA